MPDPRVVTQEVEVVTREILGNVPQWMSVSFYFLVAISLVIAGVGFARRVAQHNRGRRQESSRFNPLGFLVATCAYLATHRQLLRDRQAGIAHVLTFYGFLILFIGTCIVFLEHQTPLHFFYGWFYLIASLIIDLGGVAFLVGLTMFVVRRRRESRLMREQSVSWMLWLLLAIGVTGFLLEGLRIRYDADRIYLAVREFRFYNISPEFEIWSPVGYAIAWTFTKLGLESSDLAGGLHRFMWGTHALLCIAFFALLPWRFFSHMFYSAASWATRRERPVGQLSLPVLNENPPGVKVWADFSPLDLLQTDACTTCGRCNEVCPANEAGKPLHPREVVLGIRSAMDAPANGNGQTKLLFDFVPDEALWSCTTCGGCNHVCPVGIDVYDKIVDLRRGRVESGFVPDAAAQVFNSTFEEFNPFGSKNADRIAWASGLDVPFADEGEEVELLYWVGCAGSFDPDGRSVSRSMIRILNHLDINYRVLGKRECCTGDPARRMGEEGLFQELAGANIERLKTHGIRRVLTHCPHCFNTFKNEYPALGADFEVEHHSQFLARMIEDGRLKLPHETGETVTFHDPCYLGRGNGETEAPRKVLHSISTGKTVEMPRYGKDSFCCGAGGGSMWLDLKGDTRVESIRVKEATETGAKTVATGCPFCKGMLEAGKQSIDDQSIKIKDLAELVAEAEGLS